MEFLIKALEKQGVQHWAISAWARYAQVNPFVSSWPRPSRQPTTDALQGTLVCAHSNKITIKTITFLDIGLFFQNADGYFQSSFIFMHRNGKLWITSAQKNSKQLPYTQQNLILTLIYTFRKLISEYQMNPTTLVCSLTMILYAWSGIFEAILVLAVGFWIRIFS